MNKPIPILYTIPNFITAGTGRAMLNVVERLDRTKFAPSVCVMRKGGDLDREVERLNIPLLETPFTVARRPYHTLLVRARRAAQVLRPYRFELWLSYHYSDDYTEPIIARFAGAKKWIYMKKNMGWGSRAWRVRSYLASSIIAFNSEMEELFFPRQREKVSLIPPGVDIFQFSPGIVDTSLRESWGFSKTTTVVMHIANLVRVKNHQFLLQALARTKSDIGLVLAGDLYDTEYVAEIRDLVDHLNLGDKVRMIGKVTDTPKLLRSADIFAFCSHKEGFGIAILEAMACGLPCVLTDLPASRDLQRDGPIAITVPTTDLEGFASALDELATQPDKRRELGAKARRHVASHYSVDHEAMLHQELYSKLRH